MKELGTIDPVSLCETSILTASRVNPLASGGSEASRTSGRS